MTRRLALVTGATGYVGGRLVPELLAAGYAVRCAVRDPEKIEGLPWADDVDVVRVDVASGDGLREAFDGVDAAYYLIHSIGGRGDWVERDRTAAAMFRDAAAAAGVEQIVFLGGLGEDDTDDDLSEHLESRHDVGRVLADGPVPVTELRAAIVIGSGSASFEMLRNLVEVLPWMVTPTWVRTRCQPIGIRDVLAYLVGVLFDERTHGAVLDIGGADVVTYDEMMRAYADVAGLRPRVVIRVPVLSPRLSSWWVRLVTPLPVDLARALVDSLVNEVVVRDDTIRTLVPLQPLTTREAIELAVRRVADLDVATTWAGASRTHRTPADPMPGDPDWSGGTVLEDRRTAVAEATASTVFAVVRGIGGARGWYVARPLWWLRGMADVMVGGIGPRRGRRHPDELRPGEPLDLWRVESIEPDHTLRLRAEMRLPGTAWLEWTVTAEDDGRTRLDQAARFHPRGLLGRSYWYALVPFHAFVFEPLVRALVREAESASTEPRTSAAARPT